MSQTRFFLADLEIFDPDAPQKTGERRFLCPLCGTDKPKDSGHRSLCLNSTSGFWNCKRCGAKGRLRDFDEAPQNRRERNARALKAAFDLPPRRVANSPVIQSMVNAQGVQTVAFADGQSENVCSEPSCAESPGGSSGDWRTIWESAVAVDFSPGAPYLARRGISLETAGWGHVAFVPQWHGRGALCFPFHNLRGQVVAIAGRTLRDGGLDKPAAGPKSQGAFWASTARQDATDFAELEQIIVCEAPFDALSLSEAGFAALAFGGTAPPAWLPPHLAFRRVALAFDADAAGDAASEKLGNVLASYGASCFRLRPVGAKDWNQFLVEEGREELNRFLKSRLAF